MTGLCSVAETGLLHETYTPLGLYSECQENLGLPS